MVPLRAGTCLKHTNDTMLTQQQREYLLPFAFNAALRAGAEILDIYNGADRYEVYIKSDKTPITEADKRAHNAIRECLSKSRVPLLSEEGREMIYDERRSWDLFWMVDPLDGTKEFIKGNGEFTVNIALIADNSPVLSVMYVPYLEKIYFADSEHGSFIKTGIKADKLAEYTYDDIMARATVLPIAAKANSPIKVAVSRSHKTDDTYRFVENLKLKFPDLEVVEQGSSYKFGLLAEGAVDCYVRTTFTYEWDTAAGELILRMAGGSTVAIPNKEPLEYNKLTLLNPNFFCRSKFMPGLMSDEN